MKSKASLFLMEQLIMILVFALAAAVCIGVFAKTNAISEDIARRDEAMIIARNAAEILKSSGDPEFAKKRVDTGDFELEISEENSGISGLCCGKITVSYENSEVFALTVGWQEVAP